MVNSNKSALGIIFPNSYDALVPELVNVRLMASIPFASRYRLIDFILSGMANCGINNISVMVSNNYHSLMDHLDSGREWDLVRKNGGLHIFPPFAEKESKPYTGRVGALAGILDFLRDQKEKYVFITDTNVVVNFDFKAMINAHIESGADVTVAYNEQKLPDSILKSQSNDKGFYYTLGIKDGRITKIYVNSKEAGVQNFSMNITLIDRELLIALISEAFILGQEYFERDVLLQNVDKLNMRAYKYDGYVARISDMKSYFDENMKLLDDYNQTLASHTIPIETKNLPAYMVDCITVKKKPENPAFPFVLINGGVDIHTCAFDREGDIRFFLRRKPRGYGIFPLSKGRFFYMEKDIATPSFSNPQTVQSHDMDYMGRIFKTYHTKNGVHHTAEEKIGGNILAGSNTMLEHTEDMVIEIDRNTGEIVWSLEIWDLFDDTYKD